MHVFVSFWTKGMKTHQIGYLFYCNFLNTIQHASIKMLYENQETIIFIFFYIWYLFLVIFKLYKKTIPIQSQTKIKEYIMKNFVQQGERGGGPLQVGTTLPIYRTITIIKICNIIIEEAADPAVGPPPRAALTNTTRPRPAPATLYIIHNNS